MVKVIVVLLGLAAVAQAHPILVDQRDPDPPPVLLVAPPPPPPPPAQPRVPPPPRHTRLGTRGSVGAIPLDGRTVTLLGILQVTGDLEIARRTRVFGEYEFQMMLADRPVVAPPAMMSATSPSSSPPSSPMASSLESIGHRASIGLTRVLAATTPRAKTAVFDIVGEIGGGATLASGEVASGTIPHALLGLRFGFRLDLDHDENVDPAFGFELLARAVVVPDGVGLVVGVGMQWGK